jgi:DNA-binding transcriptional MocR family regulator
VRLPAPTAEAFAQAALRNGVAVATAPALSPSTRHADRLRLSFSGPPELLEEGVRRLAETELHTR